MPFDSAPVGSAQGGPGGPAQGRPAITLTNVSKVYRRYGGRQFSTLKSALLSGSIVKNLRPSETFPALTDVSFRVV